MKKLLVLIGIILGIIIGTIIIAKTAEAQTPPSTVHQGGTGWGKLELGNLLFGQGLTLPGSLRVGTSTGLTFATSTRSLAFNFGSTTALTISGTGYIVTASTTNLTVGAVPNCSGTSALTTNSSGIVACGAITSSASFPFTSTTYGGQTVNATSTGMWFTGTPLSVIATSTFATFASSTNLTNSDNTWLTTMTSALLLTGSTGLVAEYAGTGACSAGTAVTALSALGAATCTAFNPNVFTFPFTSNLNYGVLSNSTSTPIWFTAGLFASSTSQVAYASTTAVSIFSGLYIPSAANPTVDASTVTGANRIAINSTAASSSIRFYDGTAERSLNSIYTKSTGPAASSTLAYMGAFGASGTTSLFYMNALHAFTVVSMYCKTDTGTAFVQVSDGSNLGTLVPCTTTPVLTTISSNGAFIQGEDFKVNFGSSASTPNTITASFNIQDAAD